MGLLRFAATGARRREIRFDQRRTRGYLRPCLVSSTRQNRIIFVSAWYRSVEPRGCASALVRKTVVGPVSLPPCTPSLAPFINITIIKYEGRGTTEATAIGQRGDDRERRWHVTALCRSMREWHPKHRPKENWSGKRVRKYLFTARSSFYRVELRLTRAILLKIRTFVTVIRRFISFVAAYAS